MAMRYNSDGTVHITWDDGSVYDGEYRGGTITGKGVLVYASGKRYEGFFNNSAWDGYGHAVWYDENNLIYYESEGYWKNNLREGHMKDTAYVDGIVVSVYEGEFSNDRMNGQCTITWTDGVIISGNFRDGYPEGVMKAHYPASYRVDYLHNTEYEGGIVLQNSAYTRHGAARYTTSDGTVYEGNFIMNKRNGIFKITYPDGSEKIVDFKDDELSDVIFHKDRFGNEIKQQARTETSEEQQEEPAVTDERYLHVSRDDNRQYSQPLQQDFKKIIGMHEVKKQLDTMYKRFKIDSMRQLTLGVTASKQGYYFIITGNPGTGKTTVARIIGKMLYSMNILPKDTFIEVDRSRLVGQYIGQTAQLTSEIIESARGGTLFIDEAYTLYKKDNERDFGMEAIDTLLKDMEDHRGQYCVIMAGYDKQMDDMIRNANPGLSSRFDHKIEIGDYTSDELVDILVSMAENAHFHIEKQARDVILGRINKEKIDETFDNARFARRLLDEAIEKQAIRLSENIDSISMDQLQVLKSEDFGTIGADLSTLDSTLQKLNGLIGLDSVKQEVNSLVKAIKIQNESRKRGLAIANNQIPLNMVFTGNPGTGKTTVARLLSQIYYHLGILKRPDVFEECVRADLVGRYQGETALKVKEVVRRALGGILFIDEAYSLINGSNDTFGVEAVNTLVSEIENNRENLAVILAGYTKEMNEFLNSNPGLRSRLSKIIEFPDYSLEELLQIFDFDMKNRGYQLSYDKQKLRAIMAGEMQKADFGNARGVRNIADRIIAKHNDNLNKHDLSTLDNETIVTITDEDMDI